MHMADALVSPAVGGVAWAVSGGLIAYCARKVKQCPRDDLVPMMGVLGSFIFAAQMINFSIPGTGSSGHLGGGLLLTILLGPHAAVLVMASVLTVQALFFADGGLLALGCNMINLAFFPSFVAYPLLYRVIAGNRSGALRTGVASVASAAAGLLLGATCVVLATTASGISDLPLKTFALVMLPIHLVIGIAEGLATAAVVAFVAKARPEALAAAPTSAASFPRRPILAGLAIAAILAGATLSWFSSTRPDGLEWAIAKVTGRAQVSGAGSKIHDNLAGIQDTTAILPDYGFRPNEARSGKAGRKADDEDPNRQPWPAVSAGTSISGMVGGLITLVLATLGGIVLSRHRTTT